MISVSLGYVSILTSIILSLCCTNLLTFFSKALFSFMSTCSIPKLFSDVLMCKNLCSPFHLISDSPNISILILAISSFKFSSYSHCIIVLTFQGAIFFQSLLLLSFLVETFLPPKMFTWKDVMLCRVAISWDDFYGNLSLLSVS